MTQTLSLFVSVFRVTWFQEEPTESPKKISVDKYTSHSHLIILISLQVGSIYSAQNQCSQRRKVRKNLRQWWFGEFFQQKRNIWEIFWVYFSSNGNRMNTWLHKMRSILWKFTNLFIYYWIYTPISRCCLLFLIRPFSI